MCSPSFRNLGDPQKTWETLRISTEQLLATQASVTAPSLRQGRQPTEHPRRSNQASCRSSSAVPMCGLVKKTCFLWVMLSRAWRRSYHNTFPECSLLDSVRKGMTAEYNRLIRQLPRDHLMERAAPMEDLLRNASCQSPLKKRASSLGQPCITRVTRALPEAR